MKYITRFKKLCPNWYKELMGLKHRKHVDVVDGGICMLGEAFGFTRKYTRCPICCNLPYGINPYNKEDRFEGFCSLPLHRYDDEKLDNHPTIKRLIDHMESKHPRYCKWL